MYRSYRCTHKRMYVKYVRPLYGDTTYEFRSAKTGIAVTIPEVRRTTFTYEFLLDPGTVVHIYTSKRELVQMDFVDRIGFTDVITILPCHGRLPKMLNHVGGLWMDGDDHTFVGAALSQWVTEPRNKSERAARCRELSDL